MVRFAAAIVFVATFASASSAASTDNFDCEMSDWTPQVCDAATFKQVFTRTVAKPPQGLGRACGTLTETRPGKNVNCAASGWSQWSLCQADNYKVRTRLVELPVNGHEPWVCVGETKTRRRQVVRTQKANGLACPELAESAPCDPIDCGLDTTWTTTTTCDATAGLLVQNRGEAVPAQHGGALCQASDKQRTLPGTCSDGLHCAPLSSGQYDCKPPAAVNGSITQTWNGVSIDYVDFAITAASSVELDILSMEAISNSSGGTVYVDVNGDCSAWYIDSSIVLLSVNADGSNNEVIASNDNAAAGQGLGDGSLSAADSYLSTTLPPGRYRVAVGVSSMTTAEALAKTMGATDSPRQCESPTARYGNYRLAISAHASDGPWRAPTQLTKSVVEGTITRTRDGVSVDYIKLTVPQSGTVTIEVTSHEGSSRGYVNVNGYCGSAYIDSYIYLFRATPGADTVAATDMVASNDDGGLRFNDRSVHGYDSYLSVALDRGDYVVAISAYSLGLGDAVAKLSRGGSGIYACGGQANAGHYQVTFRAPVVSPASFAGEYCPATLGQRSCAY